MANENPLLAIYISGSMSKPLHPRVLIYYTKFSCFFQEFLIYKNFSIMYHIFYEFSYYILGDFMAIVQTNINYTYERMIGDIHILNSTFPFIQIEYVGYSVLGDRKSVV